MATDVLTAALGELPAGRCAVRKDDGRVHRPAQVQANLSLGEVVGDGSGVGQRPGKSVELGDQTISGTDSLIRMGD